jgi:hypothetical protein
VLRDQPGSAFPESQAFDRQFAVDGRNDDPAILWFEGSIDNEKIPIMDAGSPHRMTGYAGKKGRGRVFDQMGIEVQSLVDVVIGRGGEACRHPAGKKWQGHQCGSQDPALDDDHAQGRFGVSPRGLWGAL